MNEFMAALHQRQSISALALEFTVLTCARTGETLGAAWGEIDLDEAMWIVPANRIKARSRASGAVVKAAMAVLRRSAQSLKRSVATLLQAVLYSPTTDQENTVSRVLCRNSGTHGITATSPCMVSDQYSEIGPVKKAFPE